MKFNKWVQAQTVERIEAPDRQRADFYSAILERKDDEESKGREGMSVDEMVTTSNLFMAAGTETTATVLAVTTYLMLKHPHVHEEIKAEIRGRFQAHDEITIDAANTLTYTIAALTEAMRYMPPVPAGFIRKVPEGGSVVSGHYLPGNCNVSPSSLSQALFSAFHPSILAGWPRNMAWCVRSSIFGLLTVHDRPPSP